MNFEALSDPQVMQINEIIHCWLLLSDMREQIQIRRHNKDEALFPYQ